MLDWWILMCNQIVTGLVVLQQNIWPLWPSHRAVCISIQKVINFFNSRASMLSQKVPPPPLLPSLLKFSCNFNDKKFDEENVLIGKMCRDKISN